MVKHVLNFITKLSKLFVVVFLIWFIFSGYVVFVSETTPMIGVGGIFFKTGVRTTFYFSIKYLDFIKDLNKITKVAEQKRK